MHRRLHQLGLKYGTEPIAAPPPAGARREATPAELMGRIAARLDLWGGGQGCWVWTGAVRAKASNKHGMFGFRENGRDVTRYVHRWVYEYLVGPVGPGLVLDHLCRNDRCCNPDHLEPVSDAENLRRGLSPYGGLKRHVVACGRGHPRVPENINQYGACKPCIRQRQNAAYAANRRARGTTS